VGHRFNPDRLLLDPYARAHAGQLVWDPATFGHTIGAPGDDLAYDERDSAPFVPKSVVVDPNFDWRSEIRRRSVPCDHTIIYETHVKGFTQLNPEVEEKLRGFYAGLGSKPVVDYIKSLGATTVELLPVHTFIDDSHLLEKGLRNYWGYNSIGFFAPDPRYAFDVANSLREFKEMLARLHERGSRSSSTSSTIIPPRATSAARHCRFEESTTVSTIGSRLISRATTSTTPALGTPSTSVIHADSNCRRQPSLLGKRNAGRRFPVRSGDHPPTRTRRLRDDAIERRHLGRAAGFQTPRIVLRFPCPAQRAPLHSGADCAGKLSPSSRKRQLQKKIRSCLTGLLDFQREQRVRWATTGFPVPVAILTNR
jgi:hypothetical protein